MCAGLAFKLILGPNNQFACSDPPGVNCRNSNLVLCGPPNSPLIVLRNLVMLHDPAPVQGLRAEDGRPG